MSGTDDPTTPPSTVSPPADADAAPEDESFAELFAATERDPNPRRVSVGDLVSGRVIAVGATSIFVALGDKGEAVLDAAEFRDPETGEIGVAVGDAIEATVVDDGSRSGSPVLRRAMGRGGHVAAELEQAFANELPVEGLVTAEIKGGFDVQIGRMRAFCPGSQIDLRRGGERVPGSDYVGRRFSFRITKLEEGGRNVVVSRRDLLEAEAASAAERAWERIFVGAVLDGTVVSIRDYGAFVDLGGVEGMIHVSELGYSRVERPGDVLTVGQPVRVQVVKIDDRPDGRRQIGLSLKALAEDPWTTVAQRFPAGTDASGTVRRLEAFGAFVEIAPGVEGLVHISKITSERRLAHARQALAVGQTVEVTVLSIDPEQRRISLSMIERAKQQRDAQERSDRDEELRTISELNKPKSFGTFADLLAGAKKK